MELEERYRGSHKKEVHQRPYHVMYPIVQMYLPKKYFCFFSLFFLIYKSSGDDSFMSHCKI